MPGCRWLVTLTEVEELKCIVRLLPIALTLVVYNVICEPMICHGGDAIACQEDKGALLPHAPVCPRHSRTGSAALPTSTLLYVLAAADAQCISMFILQVGPPQHGVPVGLQWGRMHAGCANQLQCSNSWLQAQRSHRIA